MKSIRVEQFVHARRGQPMWVRAANRVGALLPRAIAPSADAWWEQARKREPDAGDASADAKAALEVLVDSITSDMRLSFLGRMSARDDTVRMARTHLRVQRALRQTPAILDTRLPDAVFIIGWPRTGTTALHQLLAQDPGNRTIPYWESFDPVPPREGPDRRAAKLDRMLAQLARIAPGYEAIHPMGANMPEECVALFMNELRTLQYDIQYHAPGYVSWLLAQDARIAYRGYRRQLQLIQYHRPAGERMVLKDPTHLVHLEAIIELFPTTRFVFTHRDPATAISSLCSLHAYTRALFSDAVDPNALGREILYGHWPEALDHADEIRRCLTPGRFTDVRHCDLQRDPMATVEKIYADLRLALSEEARNRMRAHVEAESAKPRHVHRYSPEGFGLTREEIRERFAGYCARFDL